MGKADIPGLCRSTASYRSNAIAPVKSANKAFNQAVGSYETRVRPAGEKIQKLRAASGGKELADVEPLDATLRLPPA